MSILILEHIDRLLQERANDRAQREAARTAFDMIMEVLKSRGKSALRSGAGDIYFISSTEIKKNISKSKWDLVSSHMDDFILVFSYKPPGDKDRYAGGYYDIKKEYTVLNIFSKDVEAFESKMEKPDKILNRRRKTFIHEYFHHLDNMRTDGAMFGDDRATPDQYANSPAEMNAHFQELALSIQETEEQSINDALASLDYNGEDERAWSDLKYRLKPWGSNNVDRYYNIWLDNSFTDHLTPKNERRIKKRIYSIYDGISEYAREGLERIGLLDKAKERGLFLA